MITVVHFCSYSMDHYLYAFDGDVDTNSKGFWKKVKKIYGDEAEYLEVRNTILISKDDFK